MTNYVWYASYGSNISTERFLCYIHGGRANGAQTSEEGCRDKTNPIKYKNIEIFKKQYFAKSAYRWQDKGVAFVDSKTSSEITYGRMYLITDEQFADVVKQENRMKTGENLDLKLQEARHLDHLVIINDSWYGRLLFLGENDGYPIYTFTNIIDVEDEVLTHPSKEYLQMIGSGLYENYHFTKKELSNYFMQKCGIKDYYTKEQMDVVLSVIYEKK